MAISLDGHTATAPGESPWISGERSRALVHRWRAESDAIAVGIGTVLADDPLLTARAGTEVRQPTRVVFDRGARLPRDSQLVRTLDVSPVVVVVSAEAERDRTEALRSAGAELLVADSIEAALAELGRRGITNLFLEGGRTLAAAFAAAGQVDEARVFVAPVLLAGGNRLDPIDPNADDQLVVTRFREW
jgi:diaminohydroxyphosphoribosylaminopyrimidine deaminase/5-amino-6-(5-phosphoribosylamino)uracil reductase